MAGMPRAYPARGTTKDVVIDELCTNIVNNMPKLKPLNTVLKINLSKKLSILVNTIRRKSFTIEKSVLLASPTA